MGKQPDNQGQPTEGNTPVNDGAAYGQEFLAWLWHSDDKEAKQARESIEQSKRGAISQEVKRQKQKL